MMQQLMTEVYAGVYLGGAPAPPLAYRSLENPNLPLNDPQVWEEVFNESYGSETGINVSADRALMYAPFYRAVQLIAGDVARLPRYVYRRRPEIGEEARERDRSHRLNYVLNVAANEETEAIKFWARFMTHALVWGNGYAFISRDGTGQPAELVNLLPDRTAPERVGGRLLYVTEISTDRGPKLQALLPEDVLHIEGLNWTSGAAPAVFRMARNSIALGLAQEKFASKFFANGGRIGGILELPIGMPKQARDTAEEGFRKAYEAGDNPFKTVILRDNAKFHAAQVSPQDSQMVEATEAQTRQIAHWFNLPPSKLGLSDSVSYNSKSEDNQNYLDTTLAIWLARIESTCNFRLISARSESSLFIEHSTKNLLRMNPLSQAQMHQIQISNRIRNPNECRADINLLPYDGGDEYVNPNTMKSGDDTRPGDKEGDDEAQEQGQRFLVMPPAKDAAYLRVLFGITASAREKSKNPNAFLVWVDGNLAKHRAEWKHLWGEKPFPFDDLRQQLSEAAGKRTATELPQAVEEICQLWEE